MIPDILAHNLVYMSHRYYFCIKARKLENQISSKFEIRDLAKIVEKIGQNCYNCSMTSSVPCGRIRQSLQKQPIMLRRNLLESWRGTNL